MPVFSMYGTPLIVGGNNLYRIDVIDVIENGRFYLKSGCFWGEIGVFLGRNWGVFGEKTPATSCKSANYNLYTLCTHYKCINRGCFRLGSHPYLFIFLYKPVRVKGGYFPVEV